MKSDSCARLSSSTDPSIMARRPSTRWRLPSTRGATRPRLVRSKGAAIGMNKAQADDVRMVHMGDSAVASIGMAMCMSSRTRPPCPRAHLTVSRSPSPAWTPTPRSTSLFTSWMDEVREPARLLGRDGVGAQTHAVARWQQRLAVRDAAYGVSPASRALAR